MHEEPVLLTAGGQPAQNGLFIWNDTDESCDLTLRYSGQEITATEDDYFEAMCTIRKSLESKRLIPHCYGASRSAFASGMSRDMGSGLQVYKLKSGEPARTVDLVSIFATGPDVEPSTVSEQRAFFEDWIASLRRRTV